MNFDIAFSLLLSSTYEGGYSNDPTDRGGETKWGITRKTWEGYGEDVTFAHMGINDAQNFYLNVFWRGASISVLDSGAVPQRLLSEIFDSVVNHGIAGGIRCLQRAYNDVSDTDALVVDGRIGNKTISAVASFCNRNSSYADALLAALRFERAGLYFNLCNDPTQKKFLRGWLRRLA